MDSISDWYTTRFPRKYPEDIEEVMVGKSPLCRYKDSLGKPRKGVHAIRIPILDLALVDVVLTILAAYWIAKYWDWSFWIVFLVIFLLGIFMHRIFCVKTKIDGVIDKIMM